MAWSPISLFVPQWEKTTGLPAGAYVLKAYIAGTSTNTPMATDSTGATQVTSITLNADGYPSVSGNIVIPHIDRSFKLALYPTQAAADANSGAVWNPDNLTPITNISFANAVNAQTTNYTVQASDKGKWITYSGAGGVTLSLQAAATAGDGFSFLVRNNTSGNVTIDPNGAEQINGVSTFVLNSGQDTIVVSNGSAWEAFDIVGTGANNTLTGINTFTNTTNFNKEIVLGSSAEVSTANSIQVVGSSALFHIAPLSFLSFRASSIGTGASRFNIYSGDGSVGGVVGHDTAGTEATGGPKGNGSANFHALYRLGQELLSNPLVTVDQAKVISTTYTAATDLLVTFWCQTTGGGAVYYKLIGKTDAASPPTTIYSYAHSGSSAATGSFMEASGSFFVKKGLNWRIDVDTNSTGVYDITTVSLGT